MQQDARQGPPGTVFSADVCIVGAGPGGLALAAELAGTPYRVILLETGGAEPDPAADRLSQLELVSEDFTSPEVGRRRQIGGMAASWNAPHPAGRGARLLPFDEIDFERRAWVPESGWPFGLDALLPYYERARHLLGVDPAAAKSTDNEGGAGPMHPDLEATRDDLVSRECVTNGLVDAAVSSPRATLLHHATAVELEMDESGSRVVALHARALTGSVVVIRASCYVLAGGAIENARLLLASAAPGREAPGNARGNVGAYYMDHLYLVAGFLWPRGQSAYSRLGFFDTATNESPSTAGRVRLSASAQRREGLLNASARIEPRLAARYVEAVATARDIRSPHAVPGKRSSLVARGWRVLRSAPAIAELVARTRGSAPLGPGWSRRAGTEALIDHFAVVMQVEQIPMRARRVELTDRLDDLGMPVAALHWGWSGAERDGLGRQAELLTSALEASGLGIVTRGGSELARELSRAGMRPDTSVGDAPTLLISSGAQHHMGTTRMHADEAHGVVDADCRVHSVANLYASGGSVFPTGGSANITLTIVALSIRLADQLRAVLRPASVE